RITAQLASKLKLQLYMDRIHKDRADAQGAKDDQAVTSIHWTSPNYTTDAAKLTATLTNTLLLEGGWSATIERYDNFYQAGLQQKFQTPLWYALAARNNTTDSTFTVAPVGQTGTFPDRYNWQGSMSYVTGAHNVKVGFLYSWGKFILNNERNADLV